MLIYFSAGNTYTAGICNQLNDGGYIDWYLPAICELSPYNPGSPASDCPASSTSIYNELYAAGIGGLVVNGQYWSTSQATNLETNAWRATMSAFPDAIYVQKFIPNGVRCTRNMAN